MNWFDRPAYIPNQREWEFACNEVAETLREPVPFPYRGISLRNLTVILQLIRWKVERAPSSPVPA
jgi:hypothetical protein